MNRREFIKACGIAAPAVAVAGGIGSLVSCAASPEKKQSRSSNGTMTYRIKPGTEEKVSLLGYGCMRWPSLSMTGAGDGEQPDQDYVNALVDRAIAAGITYFDTAPVYSKGLNERVTGNALNRYPREKWTIATKLSNFAPETWTKEKSLEIYYKSFKELQVDVIDYYLLHSVGGGDGMARFNARFVDNGMLDFLMEERQKGHIRNLGFSFHGDVEVFDALIDAQNKYKWDFVQIQMNYVEWEHVLSKKRKEDGKPASYLYRRLAEKGIPVVVMEPLLGGQLAKLPPSIAEAVSGKDPSRSEASWAFRFCGGMDNVLTVLSGMTYMEHLEDNLSTFSPLDVLTADESQMLMQMAGRIADFPSIPCTGCSYCMPCPYGVDIPGLLAHYNKCVAEGSITTDVRDPEYARLRKRFLSGYDASVHPSRQADKCIRCGQCMSKCPQDIMITSALKRIDHLTETLRSTQE